MSLSLSLHLSMHCIVYCVPVVASANKTTILYRCSCICICVYRALCVYLQRNFCSSYMRFSLARVQQQASIYNIHAFNLYGLALIFRFFFYFFLRSNQLQMEIENCVYICLFDLPVYAMYILISSFSCIEKKKSYWLSSPSHHLMRENNNFYDHSIAGSTPSFLAILLLLL